MFSRGNSLVSSSAVTWASLNTSLPEYTSTESTDCNMASSIRPKYAPIQSVSSFKNFGRWTWESDPEADTAALDTSYLETVTYNNRDFQQYSVDNDVYFEPVDEVLSPWSRHRCWGIQSELMQSRTRSSDWRSNTTSSVKPLTTGWYFHHSIIQEEFLNSGTEQLLGQ